MSAQSAAIDLIFGNPTMATDATWQDQGAGPLVPCRVIRRSPDELTDYGQSRVWTETTLVDVRVSEIANPRSGDQIVIGAETFVIQSAPRRDRERLVWTLDLRAP